MTTPRRLGAVALVALVAVVLAFDRSSSADVGQTPRSALLTGLYGSGIAMDSKNNERVGGPADQRVAYRFRATASADLVSVAVIQRGGPGYSGGDGGSMRISVESDVAGHPSGIPLAGLSFRPGNPAEAWERSDRLTFPDPVRLTAGEVYHVVFTNDGPAPLRDYISVNDDYQFTPTVPRQPAFSDDVGVLADEGTGWTVSPNDTPIVDLAYADGSHDGNAYISIIADHFALIHGPADLVRERFTVSGGSRQVAAVAARVKRISGSSPLEVRLTDADGVQLARGSIPVTAVPVSDLPAADPADPDRFIEPTLAGGVWLTLDFPEPLILVAGRTYDLRLSTAADTTFVVVPLREHSTEATPTWGSRAFRDGSGQQTTDGTHWADIYEFAPVDLQFYFR